MNDPAQSVSTTIEEENISLLDILVVLTKNKTKIWRTTLLFMTVGVLLAVFSPQKYTATAKVFRDRLDNPGRGAGAVSGLLALSGLGLQLGDGSSGLTTNAYPDILLSREIRYVIINSSFYITKLDTTMTLLEYINDHSAVFSQVRRTLEAVTIKLLGRIIRYFRPEIATRGGNTKYHGHIFHLREDEEKAMRMLSKMVNTDIDLNTGIMRIAVVTPEPLLSAQLVSAFIEELTRRVRAIHTEKARDNLDFVSTRFSKVATDLELAEQQLAHFIDANQNPSTARLRTKWERLRRHVNFIFKLYGDLQAQMARSELELQQSKPIITLLELPVPPNQRSAPKRKRLVIMFILMGVFYGILSTYVKVFIAKLRNDPVESEKMATIQAAVPMVWLGKLKRLGRRGKNL